MPMFDTITRNESDESDYAAGVVSMIHAVPLVTGPIATWLTDRSEQVYSFDSQEKI
jgi:hypothetical protein